MKRILGRSDIEISAMGMGCWAIGGPAWEKGQPIGWGTADDKESIRGLECGLAEGITFLDTSNMYGAGHSEKLIGKVLEGRRSQVVVATKFGWVFDETKKEKLGYDLSPSFIMSSCEDSLRRLRTDYIDLYLLHVGDYPANKAAEVAEVMEKLMKQGKIRAYGWSTDLPDRAAALAQGEHCAAIEHNENIFDDNPEMLALCEREGLASVNRSPLAMGLLSGKYRTDTVMKTNDIRGRKNQSWMKFFREGRPSEEFLNRIELIREVLTGDGRTLIQGALGWIWARSPQTVPIPGFRTAAQIRESAGAMQFGPLKQWQMEQIREVLYSGKKTESAFLNGSESGRLS